MERKRYTLLIALVLIGLSKSNAQEYWSNIIDKPATLGLENGFETFTTEDFTLKLVNSSQTVAALSPSSEPNFDFTPGDRLNIRNKDSLYQLGDINLTIKESNGHWRHISTAWHRSAIEPLQVSGTILAAADLSNTLPKDIPLSVNRYYEKSGKDLILRFEVANISKAPVEIGALGIPMIFNNILEGKTLDEAHTQNVFFDPYMGMDAGYLEVKRLSGHGPVLLVLPEKNMPFEAYRPLLADPSPRSVVFEGFHEWMAHSQAYAETEWKGVEQWNTPTSIRLIPDEKKNFSLRFVLADSIKGIQKKLIEKNKPVAVGIPGYVVPQDVEAQLFLKYNSNIASLKVEPEGALKIIEKRVNQAGLKRLSVKGLTWGRTRLTIMYDDGIQQTINYKVIKPESEVVAEIGHFLTTEQWFNQKDDPFHRNPSVISYDYETKRQVTQDGRVWIAGLSDEGGAGSWLAAVMKEYLQPDKKELEKLQDFVDRTLWGGIQLKEGDSIYGVKKSLFYYAPDSLPKGTYNDSINYGTWAAWDKKGADDLGRSFNYPHVTAAYWVLYRLARYQEGLVGHRKWDWYLKNAYHTAMAMTKFAPYYSQFGQMEGTVFLKVLQDLEREGLTEMAENLKEEMKKRADHWGTLNYPFGSEMPWDSTGQEEVYTWSDYFGYDDKAKITLDAVLAYMPTMPHWAYNGNARRYWDFLYGGKLQRIERQIHHYGSGINAIPVLKAYRENPDFYLLKVGYGGVMGAISNITQDGFGPAAFHSYPSTLRIDYLSGDYGPGFFGYAMNTATYIVEHSELGWLAFGGNLTQTPNEIIVKMTTAGKNRIYLAPEKLWLTLDAGAFEKITYNKKTNKVEIALAPRDEFTPTAYLNLNKEVNLPFRKVRGAYAIELDSENTTINFSL